jgi:Leucine-rich repeat (LRR) protein
MLDPHTCCTTLCCFHAECTELHLGSRGIHRLQGFERFTNLESLWLNNNCLQALNHLNDNFRIRELYVHDNNICTLKGSLHCFKFLSVLDLSNNQLGNLQKVVAMLAPFMFLENLNLSGNPCCQQVQYRLVVIHAIPSLVVLDLHMITERERHEVLAVFCLNTTCQSVNLSIY